MNHPFRNVSQRIEQLLLAHYMPKKMGTWSFRWQFATHATSLRGRRLCTPTKADGLQAYDGSNVVVIARAISEEKLLD